MTLDGCGVPAGNIPRDERRYWREVTQGHEPHWHHTRMLNLSPPILPLDVHTSEYRKHLRLIRSSHYQGELRK